MNRETSNDIERFLMKNQKLSRRSLLRVGVAKALQKGGGAASVLGTVAAVFTAPRYEDNPLNADTLTAGGLIAGGAVIYKIGHLFEGQQAQTPPLIETELAEDKKKNELLKEESREVE